MGPKTLFFCKVGPSALTFSAGPSAFCKFCARSQRVSKSLVRFEQKCGGRRGAADVWGRPLQAAALGAPRRIMYRS